MYYFASCQILLNEYISVVVVVVVVPAAAKSKL